MSRADSRGWNHRLTRAPSQTQQDSGSRRSPEPSRIRSSITLCNVIFRHSIMWLVPPGLGGEGGRSCWPAEGMCCAAQWHCLPLAAARYHNLHLLLQPEAAEQRMAAHAALLCSWHTSGVEQRVWVCVTATWDSGRAVGCEKLESGSS